MDELTIKANDLGLTAALISRGWELLEMERGESGRVYFVFENSPEINRDIQWYWDDRLRVPARRFVEDMKMLKTRIYSGE